LPEDDDDDEENLFEIALEELKDSFSLMPQNSFNIFITCMKGKPGTLGIGTFPWDSMAKKSQGGLWLNSIEVDIAVTTTLPHEIGHCFGLWHTFHGVEESDIEDECNICYEFPHERGNYKSNYVGDLCDDTLSTSVNFNCSDPLDKTCNGENWGKTDWNNVMGYSQYDMNGKESNCATFYSRQQTSRMHCYLSSILKSWLIN